MFEYAARDEPTTVKQIRKRGSRWLNVKSPGTVFLSMFPHNLVVSMQWEYNLYSQQKEISLGVDKMEALTLLGIMLLSGYSRLSYSRLYLSE